MEVRKKRQRSGDHDNNEGGQTKRCRDRKDENQINETLLTSDNFLQTLHVYIVKAGIEKARQEIFIKQVKRFGGRVSDVYDENISLSHVIVDDKMEVDRLMRLLNVNHFPNITVMKCTWLSSCLKHKKLVDHEDFELKAQKPDTDRGKEDDDNDNNLDKSGYNKLSRTFGGSSSNEDRKDQGPSYVSPTKANEKPSRLPYMYQSDSDYEPSDEDNEQSDKTASHTQDASSSTMYRKSINVSGWICAQSSKNPKPNLNSHITSKLEEMVKAYESTNDKWRAFGYQKAIQALRRHPKEISSWEEAKALPGVGGRLADKIWEIAESGELRKLAEFKSSEEVNVLQIFKNVWGAGPHTAQLWYQQGFRSIKDLQEKANLNHQQKVGVHLYDDLNERMSREEAGKIEQIVREIAESLLPGVVAQACGSYRRGKPTCGDVDVLVTHPDGRSHKGLFSKLLSKLKENNFLTDDLVTAEDSGNQKKYLGVCKLPGNDSKHRRLDIIVVPYEEYGCALVYFTGSAHFNRSLRHMCKKQNMSLNEHALKTGVVRKGKDKIHEGTVIPTPTEEDVFKVLQIPYRPPEERDH